MNLFRVLALSLSFLAVLPAGAALPLKSIKEFQAKSPELLEIRVSKVKKTAVVAGRAHSYHVQVEAKVLRVHRTENKLAEGDEITITYSLPNQKKSPAAGDFPSEVAKGVRYNAYLSVMDVKKRSCRPAAYSGSFERVKP